MALTIQPFEQVLAEFITGKYMTSGQDATTTAGQAAIVQRANTALEVVAAFNSINQGNVSGLQSLQAVLSSTTTDPAMALVIQNLFTIGGSMLALNTNIVNGLPLIGATANQIASNIGAGITAAANAEIAKYSPAKT